METEERFKLELKRLKNVNIAMDKVLEALNKLLEEVKDEKKKKEMGQKKTQKE